MNKNLKANEILEILRNSDYKEIFKALVLFENAEIKEKDIKDMYYNFIRNDSFAGFIDIKRLKVL